ncbi:MAG: TIGR01777 family protein [Pirellula sp.]|nr:TIGR01777 family protein [Pirellula sp.]
MPALQNQRIVVTGATGLVGSLLCTELEKAGAQVIRAVRRPVQDEARELYWNPDRGEIDRAKLEGVDAVVHLAGENIAGGRWTEAFKQKILDSRIKGTHLISDALARLERKPRVFICASAIGYYGNRGADVMTEQSAPDTDFLAKVCQQWEASCQAARDAGIPVTNIRIGVVLSPDGGALAKMLTPFKLGAGGKIGSGDQYMSWIALDDLVGAIVYLLARDEPIVGPVNIVAPNPATNLGFTKTLGRVLSRPTFFPMPAFAARLAFGEMADALLLSSTRVAPQALISSGFKFQYPELEPALRRLLNR